MRKQRKGRILEIGMPRQVGHRKPVRALSRLLVILLVIPLLIAMVVRDPQGMAHLLVFVITAGARMLSATAAFLDGLLGGR